jgi:hypothetical protein
VLPFFLVCSQTTITSKDDSKRKSCKRGNAADCASTTSKDDREINSCERGGGGGEECDGTTRNLFLSTTPLPTASTPDFRSEVLRVLFFQHQNFNRNVICKYLLLSKRIKEKYGSVSSFHSILRGDWFM